jgi:hypothetical protein
MKRTFPRFNITPLMFVFGLLVGAGATGSAWAYQTHMHSALNALTKAQQQLQAAIPDKDGHREQAMNLVGQAISQTQQGIAAGAK